MATVNIVFAQVGGAGIDSRLGVYQGHGAESEDITSSATSQQSTGVAKDQTFIRITTTGGAIRILTGVNPTALTSSILVLDDTTMDLAVRKGDKIAVIDN